MFVNGWREREEPVLDILGLPRGTFEHWVTPEETHVVKPDPKHFRAILDYTKLLPENHLVIGDRLEVDLLPAKEMGMNTCLVNSPDISGGEVDYSLTSVYDLQKVLN